MTVYIDVVFLENLILNVIILYATSLIAKINLKIIRTLISACIGSIYAIMYYIFQIGLYSNIIFKFVLSVIMIYVAFNPKEFKTLLKVLILFYLTSFVFGGASLSVIYLVNAQRINIQNGMIIGKYTMNTIFTGIIIAFIVIVIAFKIIKSKISKNDLFCDIRFKINNKEIKTKAMLDTGNLLKEPITNIPVVVVEHKLLYDVIPNEILDNIENILGGDLEDISDEVKSDYISKLKVIPFTSLGKQNGILLGIKADELIVEEMNSEKKIDKVIIGIYNKELSKKRTYSALIGIDVI